MVKQNNIISEETQVLGRSKRGMLFPPVTFKKIKEKNAGLMPRSNELASNLSVKVTV